MATRLVLRRKTSAWRFRIQKVTLRISIFCNTCFVTGPKRYAFQSDLWLGTTLRLGSNGFCSLESRSQATWLPSVSVCVHILSLACQPRDQFVRHVVWIPCHWRPHKRSVLKFPTDSSNKMAKVQISKAGITQKRIIYSYEIMYENEWATFLI
jgi:hypothetical protein